MKIASFNVENLFERVNAMNDTVAKGREVLNDYAAANSILAKPSYSATDKKMVLAILGSTTSSRQENLSTSSSEKTAARVRSREIKSRHSRILRHRRQSAKTCH